MPKGILKFVLKKKMSGKDKNRKDQLSDFLRYRENKMPDKEKNVFEKNLQKDPFAEEALQGYETIDDHHNVEGDILKLKKRLQNRSFTQKRIIWYRIAASLAVLMIISSIFIVIERTRPEEQLSYAPELPKGITESPAQSEKLEPVSDKEIKAETPKEEKMVIEDIQKPVIKSEQVEQSVNKISAGDKADAIAVTERSESKIYMEENLASRSAMAKKAFVAPSLIKGKVISSEDNRPVPGVSINIKGTDKGTVTDTGGNFSLGVAETDPGILVARFIGMEPKEFRAAADSVMEIKLKPTAMAMSEVVVVGYGVAGAGSEKDDEDEGYNPPEPVAGKAAFDKYILDNLKRPDKATEGQRVVVVAGFIVRQNGEIDSIKIIRSPAESFSEEAMRLIRQGPAWKPAERNGKTFDDDVRIRIVFK